MSDRDPADATATSDPLALARAFSEARFHVELGSERLELRVGQPCPELEAQVAGASYGYLTAWNPEAQARDTPDNMCADDRLAARAAMVATDMRRCWSEDAHGGHREAGWLLVDVTPDTVDRLGREFSQAGVLAWARGEPVRLRMLRHAPPGSGLLTAVDWIE